MKSVAVVQVGLCLCRRSLANDLWNLGARVRRCVYETLNIDMAFNEVSGVVLFPSSFLFQRRFLHHPLRVPSPVVRQVVLTRLVTLPANSIVLLSYVKLPNSAARAVS